MVDTIKQNQREVEGLAPDQWKYFDIRLNGIRSHIRPLLTGAYRKLIQADACTIDFGIGSGGLWQGFNLPDYSHVIGIDMRSGPLDVAQTELNGVQLIQTPMEKAWKALGKSHVDQAVFSEIGGFVDPSVLASTLQYAGDYADRIIITQKFLPSDISRFTFGKKKPYYLSDSGLPEESQHEMMKGISHRFNSLGLTPDMQLPALLRRLEELYIVPEITQGVGSFVGLLDQQFPLDWITHQIEINRKSASDIEEKQLGKKKFLPHRLTAEISYVHGIIREFLTQPPENSQLQVLDSLFNLIQTRIEQEMYFSTVGLMLADIGYTDITTGVVNHQGLLEVTDPAGFINTTLNSKWTYANSHVFFPQLLTKPNRIMRNPIGKFSRELKAIVTVPFLSANK